MSVGKNSTAQQAQNSAQPSAESRRIVSRKEAKALGLARYFTGIPCKHGHIDERITKYCHCISCRDESLKNRSEYFRAYNRSEKARAAKKSYEEVESNKIAKRDRARYRYNSDKVKYREKAVNKYYKSRSRILENKSKRTKERRSEDETFRAAESIRSMVSRVIRLTGARKSTTSEKLVGYSRSELVEHLQRQFVGDMNWSNWGRVWEIDHVTPVSVMIGNGITDPKLINALPNLKPIYKSENRSKGNKEVYLL